MNGDVTKVKELLEAKSDPNIKNWNGKTPLFYLINSAGTYNNTKAQLEDKLKNLITIAGLLKQYGAEPDIVDNTGRTPLSYATVSLIQKTKDQNLTKDKRKKNKYELVITNVEGVIEELVKMGANINHTSAKGTVLHRIVSERVPEIANFLVKYVGADINAKNDKGNTPLHIMIKKGRFNKEAINNYIDLGADINATNNVGNTPLHYTTTLRGSEKSNRFDEDAAKLLLAKGAKQMQNNEGKNPLDLAIKEGKTGVITVLLGPPPMPMEQTTPKKLDVRPDDPHALNHAYMIDNYPEFIALLQGGADPNWTNKNNDTMLHLLSDKYTMDSKPKGWEMFSALTQYGANPNKHNNDGDTPLHIAARTENEQAIRHLLTKGAYKGEKNNLGKTPEDLAKQTNNYLIIDLVNLRK